MHVDRRPNSTLISLTRHMWIVVARYWDEDDCIDWENSPVYRRVLIHWRRLHLVVDWRLSD